MVVMANEITVDAAEVENIVADAEYSYYGLRSLHTGNVVDASLAEPVVGGTVDNSYAWEDNQPTDVELDGVCAVHVTEDRRSIERAITVLADYPCDGYTVLLGANRMSYGQDDGEIVLRDPVVLAVYR